jgi:phospholipase/carboxylesterase
MPHLLPCVEIETASQPRAAVIWLHGLGADGHDFAGLVPELDLSGCPAIRFVFPHAPAIPVTVNGGYVMPAWYDIAQPDLAQLPDRQGIENSQAAINALIEREIERGIAPEQIVLAGFSQGCVMALHTGLRATQRLAGIVALSGYLPLPELLPLERQAVNNNVPVFMGHGERDPVVPMARGELARDTLQSLGYAVEWHSYLMQHSVHPQEVADISAFLQRVLASPK